MKNIEMWKDVIGYKGHYIISSLGTVKSLKWGKERVRKPSLMGEYYAVNLYLNNNKKTRTIHQLMAESFLGHIPCGMELVVDHKDTNKLNNNINNLQITTNRTNSNRKHIKSSSQYVGVSWDKNSKKWKCQITINGKRKHLGLFLTDFEAHIKYQNELLKISEDMQGGNR